MPKEGTIRSIDIQTYSSPAAGVMIFNFGRFDIKNYVLQEIFSSKSQGEGHRLNQVLSMGKWALRPLFIKGNGPYSKKR